VTNGCAAGSARLALVTGLRVLAGLRPPLTLVGWAWRIAPKRATSRPRRERRKSARTSPDRLWDYVIDPLGNYVIVHTVPAADRLYSVYLGELRDEGLLP
jgi:hypothetical protein